MRTPYPAIALILLANGCADGARLAREVTYPNDFRYLTDAEVRKAMHGLWAQIRELDHALVEPVAWPQVVQVLDRLRAETATLHAGPARSDRPAFQHRLGEFRRRLEDARLAALKTPPDPRPALSVVDGCARCHTLHR